MSQATALKIEEYHVESEPYYEPVGKEIELFEAGPDFCMAISYNPGYQGVLKDLKQSTRQRFVALEFDYPSEATEQAIVAKEAGIDAEIATKLVKFAGMTRNLKGSGLEEGASTRLLVHTGKLIASGIDPVTACRGAISEVLTDDAEMLTAVNELSRSVF
jgi:nitric oxide reductase NorQ protein